MCALAAVVLLGATSKRKNLKPVGWWLLPTPFDIIRLLFGTRYDFAFPFCLNCAPENFQLNLFALTTISPSSQGP